ncbi:MAG: hypothetical protein RLZZ337_409 [Bacteroidota bacterium]|jgi:2-oxoisovalerate dehydrogenase E1 component
MKFDHYSYDKPTHMRIYAALVKPRLIEEKMLKLLRQGQVSKWFSGIGQEAISVGATLALENDEYIMPLHRNLGVFTTRGIPFKKLLHQWQGNDQGFTKGRDRSFHFGTNEYHIAGMISHLGAMLSVADGVALANKLDEKSKISVAFSGDGGTSEGEFHEAVNLAAVWDLPVLFLIENNGYGLSTPSNDQFRCNYLSEKGIGYGIESKTIDGNNVLEVYTEVQKIARQMRRNPKPFILECTTFRMRGHEEASGTKYVPQELLAEWSEKDPIENYRSFLLSSQIISEEDINHIHKEIFKEIDEGVKILSKTYKRELSVKEEVDDVYKLYKINNIEPNPSTKEMRFIDAIKEGLELAMDRHKELILMGQDIAEYGGVFKITDGFVSKFGKGRVRNTPISEAAPLGAALGLSIAGKKAMVEMQFADFVSCGFNQVINNLAKTYYRWGQNADVVIRMPTGGGSAAGPFHSQSTEAWFFHTPGLKVVYPSSPEDAKGLLLASFEDPNPVLFFEHKYLYRNEIGMVPEGYYTAEIGKARTVKEGNEVGIIAYGWAVKWCEEIVNQMEISAEILDLRTLQPWDKLAVENLVEKTGKILIVHEDTLEGGIGGEIAAWIGEHCFTNLDAPVMRVASLDTPIPFSANLEQQFLGKSRLEQKLTELLKW